MDMVVHTIILAPGRLGRRAAVAVSYPELHSKFTVHLGIYRNTNNTNILGDSQVSQSSCLPLLTAHLRPQTKASHLYQRHPLPCTWPQERKAMRLAQYQGNRNCIPSAKPKLGFKEADKCQFISCMWGTWLPC